MNGRDPTRRQGTAIHLTRDDSVSIAAKVARNQWGVQICTGASHDRRQGCSSRWVSKSAHSAARASCGTFRTSICKFAQPAAHPESAAMLRGKPEVTLLRRVGARLGDLSPQPWRLNSGPQSALRPSPARAVASQPMVGDKASRAVSVGYRLLRDSAEQAPRIAERDRPDAALMRQTRDWLHRTHRRAWRVRGTDAG